MKQGDEESRGGASALGLAFMAWLIPGYGHYWLGHRYRGALFCLAISGMLVLGLAFGEYTVISWQNHRLAMFLQVFAGLPTLLAAAYPWVNDAFPPTLAPGVASPYIDLGLALTLVAGALNALLVADAYYRASGGEEEAEA